MAGSDVAKLELRLKQLERSHNRLQRIVHFYSLVFAAVLVAILSAVWYAKRTFLPQLITVISAVRSANGFFRDRASAVSTPVDTALDYLEKLMGKVKQ